MAKQIHEIRVEPLSEKGGVLAHTTFKLKRGGQGGGPLADFETERTHHATMESLHAHMQKHMGQMFADEEKGEKGESPAEEKKE